MPSVAQPRHGNLSLNAPRSCPGIPSAIKYLTDHRMRNRSGSSSARRMGLDPMTTGQIRIGQLRLGDDRGRPPNSSRNGTMPCRSPLAILALLAPVLVALGCSKPAGSVCAASQSGVLQGGGEIACSFEPGTALVVTDAGYFTSTVRVERSSSCVGNVANRILSRCSQGSPETVVGRKEDAGRPLIAHSRTAIYDDSPFDAQQVARLNAILADLTVYAGDGELIIEFDVPENPAWYSDVMKVHLLVRLFDQNGQYLTHFTSKEIFSPIKNPTSFGVPYRGGDLRILDEGHNRLVYRVNQRDLAYAAVVEVGFTIPPHAGS